MCSILCVYYLFSIRRLFRAIAIRSGYTFNQAGKLSEHILSLAWGYHASPTLVVLWAEAGAEGA